MSSCRFFLASGGDFLDPKRVGFERDDMARLLTEFGMGSSLRRQDYTQAAVRAVKDALWHNSINLAELFGREKGEMQILVEVGVQAPDQVDVERVAEIFPYGAVEVVARQGGLDVPRSDGGKPTVIANVAISVALDLEGAA
jgi:uncharacterized protein (TIGR02058 family)